MNREDIKCISEEGAKVLRMLCYLAEKKDYYKLDNTNGLFVPLSIEILERSGNTFVNYDLSICHYLEQNGDLMADPEMCFLKIQNSWYPYYFLNHFAETQTQSLKFSNFEITGIKRNLYLDHLEFAEIWLQNIKEQQEI